MDTNLLVLLEERDEHIAVLEETLREIDALVRDYQITGAHRAYIRGVIARAVSEES